MTFHTQIKIEGKKVGNGHPSFIIAEIGVNHNGDMELAKRLIDQAARCGVDCVKFQTFRAEEFLADLNQNHTYMEAGKIKKENTYRMFKRLELPIDQHQRLFDYARKRKLIPLTSVADVESLECMEDLGVAAHKLSSEDFINLPLLEHALSKSTPLLLSTGMALPEEMDDVLKRAKKFGKKNIIFLHCVSVYPTPPSQANLRRLLSLKKKFNSLIGYSDHTLGIEASLGAVALGACVIEKHFTHNKKAKGPDHSVSADPKEMKQLVESVRLMEEFLGDGRLEGYESEEKSRKEFRRSLVAATDLPKGHILKLSDLSLKRPGTGFRFRDKGEIIGKKLKTPLKQNQQLLKKHIF